MSHLWSPRAMICPTLRAVEFLPWPCGGAIDGGSIFASSSETALPDLANVSDQSSGRDCGHPLFHRANGDLPDFFVFVVLSHHRPRVLHFGVAEHPSLGWFCIPFAHISRTLTFYVSSSSLLLFSLQASVADPR
jgi:hypothetical protein